MCRVVFCSDMIRIVCSCAAGGDLHDLLTKQHIRAWLVVTVNQLPLCDLVKSSYNDRKRLFQVINYDHKCIFLKQIILTQIHERLALLSIQLYSCSHEMKCHTHKLASPSWNVLRQIKVQHLQDGLLHFSEKGLAAEWVTNLHCRYVAVTSVMTKL